MRLAGTAEVTLVMGSRPFVRKILVQEGAYVIGPRWLTRTFDHLQAPAARNREEPTSAPPSGKRHRGCRNVRPGSSADVRVAWCQVRLTSQSRTGLGHPGMSAKCQDRTSAT